VLFCSGIVSSVFTQNGEGFYLVSPSEMARFSVSAHVVTRPCCVIRHHVTQESTHRASQHFNLRRTSPSRTPRSYHSQTQGWDSLPRLFLLISAPSLWVYYCQQLTLCPFVCLFVCHKFQIASFLFLDGIEPFSGRQLSMTPSTKRSSSIFDLGP